MSEALLEIMRPEDEKITKEIAEESEKKVRKKVKRKKKQKLFFQGKILYWHKENKTGIQIVSSVLFFYAQALNAKMKCLEEMKAGMLPLSLFSLRWK